MQHSDYAENISETELLNTPKCYLTYHNVKHPQKKKMRVVFNASLLYDEISLYNSLLTDPDFISNLQRIPLRFGQEKCALIADIKQMLYQIQVILKK